MGVERLHVDLVRPDRYGGAHSESFGDATNLRRDPGHLSAFGVEGFKQMIAKVVKDYPFKVVATTLRKAKTATLNDWGAICYHDGKFYQAKNRENLEIFDRVGGGDSFASGLIYGFLAGQDPQWSVECGAAHGALAMTTPGDTSMVTFQEVMQVMKGVGARIAR